MVIAVASIALLMQRVGNRGRQAEHRLAGCRPGPVRPCRSGADRPRRVRRGPIAVSPSGIGRSDGVAVLPAMYIAWALTMLFAKAALHVQASPARFLATFVFFRVSGAPLPGLGVGPLLLTVALTIAVDAGVRWARAERFRGGPAVGDSVGLAVIALVYRTLCTATGNLDLFGPLSWLPELPRPGRCWSRPRADRLGGRRRADPPTDARSVGSIVAVVSFGARRVRPRSAAVTATQLGRRRACVRARRGGRSPQACLCACLHRSARADPTDSAPRSVTALAVAAPGILLVAGPAFTLVARQYHERVVEFDGGVFLPGNLVAPFIWSLLISCAFGVIVVATVGAHRPGAASAVAAIVRSRLALPAVVATGFFVRVITLLTVAPERTDGGDPLFYHTTANVLARGRGFPEPLNWIAFEAHRPSAFHGPLYPVVLSISSRFGGTSYFDHKMMSIVIGTGSRAGGRDPRTTARRNDRRIGRGRIRRGVSEPVADRQPAVSRRA